MTATAANATLTLSCALCLSGDVSTMQRTSSLSKRRRKAGEDSDDDDDDEVDEEAAAQGAARRHSNPKITTINRKQGKRPTKRKKLAAKK